MNIIVFDTETAGMVTQSLLNVGYEIIDLNLQTNNFEVLQKRDYLISEVYKEYLFMINDNFVGQEKYDRYAQLLGQKKIIKRTPKQAFKTMCSDIKKYNVLFGYAYNADFDKDKFAKTANQKNIFNPLDLIPVFDIWAYAINYICKTNDYIDWAKENEIFTKTQTYISTSVESICKYIYNDLNFVETHTALDDVQHEIKILTECVKRGCDITRAMSMGGRFIPSEKEFTKTLIFDGKEYDIKYKKETEKNGVVKFI